MTFPLWLIGASAPFCCQAVLAAVPVQVQSFASSSGKTSIQYFSYDAGPCGSGSVLSCDFRGIVHVPPGYSRADVFLSGFTLKTAVQSDAVSQVSVRASKYKYDPAAGALEVGVGAGFSTRSGQNFGYSMTFVVLLTQPGVAAFSSISTGCAGVASCKISRVVPMAVPAGMQYIGLGTQLWELGSHSGPIFINTLAAHIDSLTVQPPSTSLDYWCEMHNGKAKNLMFCEWSAELIAFDPSEMEQNGSSLFPQYTFFSTGLTTHPVWINQSSSPSHAPIKGFLDAFEGLILSYQTFPYHAGTNYPIWQVDASATSFGVSPTAADTALTTYGVFLGVRFGNSTNTAKYLYQESRAFGLLR
jgi:hypothetical protein